MKRIILLSFLIFSVSGNIFAQPEPVATFHTFWKAALLNDFEIARKFFTAVSQDQENRDKQIRESFQVVSQNKLEFPELDNSQIFPVSAYFNFRIETKEKKKFKGEVLLLNQDGEWKVFLFDVRPAGEIKTISPPLPDFPATKNCSICG